MCLCNAYLQISDIYIMLPWNYNWNTLPFVILLWTLLQGTGENIKSYWMEGLGTSVLTFLLKAELSLGAITLPHPGISESYSHSHRTFKRASEHSWRKPFGLFQSFFHLREDLQFYEAENHLKTFEFQLCVVGNEDPDYLIPVSERASVSGNATVTTENGWLLRGLRGFDKSGFFQVPGSCTEFLEMSTPFFFFPWERQIICLTLPLLVKSTLKNNWIDSVVFLPSCADRIIQNPQKYSDNIQ